ncbi:MAG TPA: DNA repair helicase XPB [Rectinemataceae bacterium]|nr:DNA repair helicase XPB [Rectinemataceae bacterium]
MADGRPLIVQSDLSLLLDVHDPAFEEARAEIGVFASLEKSPEHLHSYRIGALSLWNAASAGLQPDEVLVSLARWSRYDIPGDVAFIVKDTMSRFGRLVLGSLPGEEGQADGALAHSLLLRCPDPELERELGSSRSLAKFLRPVPGGFAVRLVDRGTVKRELLRLGWPVRDEAPLVEGDPMPLALLPERRSGGGFSLRPYQSDALSAFVGGNLPGSGYGVIVLPCGAGKTIVGMAAMAAIGAKTLIITTNVAAVHQWIDELLDKTDLDPNSVGEYTGSEKTVRSVTVATYQILTWRPDKTADFPHFELFRRERWGLIIYDEVHILPAPVFRVVAEIQAVRRLGLTATLVREDGREEDVFSLIGPKRYDVPWKDLERKGFIAEAWCREIRIPLSSHDELRYSVAEQREKHRLAAENSAKLEAVRELVDNHPDDLVMVIGQFLDQLGKIAKLLDAPLITGKTPNPERERIYEDFRRGRTRVIVVSKVANFAIDLPDASVAIQVSGSFGSRQEEAQRLGRILRPKDRNSFFYSLVSRYTIEEDFSANRRKFLTEQGYRYQIEAWE